MESVELTVISRELIREYGYDDSKISDERLQEIAHELLEYWGENGFETALDFVLTD
jgi:hypothetical protein